MKNTLLTLFAICAFLWVTAAPASQPVTVPSGAAIYIEHFSADQFSIEDRLGDALMRRGYRLVASSDRAQYVVKWSYAHGASTYASVRVLNPSGDVLSFGEGHNPGFGTIINKTGSTWGCVKRTARSAGLDL